MFQTNGFGSITVSSDVQDLVALTNDALSISITEKKELIDDNTIRLALHKQTWGSRPETRPIEDHGILFYKIGRAIVQNLLLSHCLIDPISIYIKKRSLEFYLSNWYFELRTSISFFSFELFYL